MRRSLIIVLAVVAVVLGVLLLFNGSRHRSLVSELQIEKQDLQSQIEALRSDYDSLSSDYEFINAQLDSSREEIAQLVERVKTVSATNRSKIRQYEKELGTLRSIMRSYIVQIDSLNRLNENLKRENTRVTAELEQRTQQVVGLSSEKASLSEKVAIAAQLDATNITLSLLDKKDKTMKKPKLKDCRKMQVSFTISRNVTASNGNRTVYVRIQNPGGNVLGGGGTFPFENRDIECSARKVVEYTGEETSVSVFWPVTQMLEKGQYRVSIFTDGHMIGSRTFNFE